MRVKVGERESGCFKGQGEGGAVCETATDFTVIFGSGEEVPSLSCGIACLGATFEGRRQDVGRASSAATRVNA